MGSDLSALSPRQCVRPVAVLDQGASASSWYMMGCARILRLELSDLLTTNRGAEMDTIYHDLAVKYTLSELLSMRANSPPQLRHIYTAAINLKRDSQSNHE
jgi:hypothetical protein